jgi:hypothetical protein
MSRRTTGLSVLRMSARLFRPACILVRGHGLCALVRRRTPATDWSSNLVAAGVGVVAGRDRRQCGQRLSQSPRTRTQSRNQPRVIHCRGRLLTRRVCARSGGQHLGVVPEQAQPGCRCDIRWQRHGVRPIGIARFSMNGSVQISCARRRVSAT